MKLTQLTNGAGLLGDELSIDSCLTCAAFEVGGSDGGGGGGAGAIAIADSLVADTVLDSSSLAFR